jgi:hypothetical protein
MRRNRYSSRGRVARIHAGRPRTYKMGRRVDFIMETMKHCELFELAFKKGVTVTHLLNKYVEEGMEREKFVQIPKNNVDVTYTKWFNDHKDDDVEKLK